MAWKRHSVNLVERPEWSDYDPAGDLDHAIFNSAVESMSSITWEDMSSYAEDVLNAGPSRKLRNIVTSEEAEALLNAFRNGDQRLETFTTMIRDGWTWAWEKAFTPDDGDIQAAMDDVISDLERDANVLYDFEALMEVVDHLDIKKEVFFRKLLQAYIDYEREEDRYDRFVVFDPKFVWKEEAGWYGPRTGSFMEWMPFSEVARPKVKAELEELLKSFEEPYLERVFQKLKHRMDSRDAYNYLYPDRMWRDLLKSSPKEVKGAQEELRTFLKELRKVNA